MKKISLFCLCIFISVSCQHSNSDSSKKREFKGFGELIIGKEFKSLKSYAQFETVCKNSYYAEKYEISKEIGVVEGVTVLLKNEKIHDVSFDNSSISNKNKIDSCFRSCDSKVLNIPYSGKNWRVYNSSDDKVRFTMTIIDDDYLYHRLGYYPTNYFYYDLSDEDKNDYGI